VAAPATPAAGEPNGAASAAANEAYLGQSPAGSPRDLVSQVVSNARLLRGRAGGGTLEIQLHPAALGRVYLRLSSGAMPGGAIQLLVRAERPKVAEAIRQGVVELGQALEGQGLRVGSINVSNFRDEPGLWFNSGSGGGFGTWPDGRGTDEGNPAAMYRTPADSAPAAAAHGSPATESQTGGGLPGWGIGGWLNVFA
jgi:hypothetical protein